MKKFCLGLVFSLALVGLKGQCVLPPGAKTQNPDVLHIVNNLLVPNPVFESKLVRVNVHFMLRNDGTGNFTETGDNLGYSYTGYDYATDMVNYINWRMSDEPNLVLNLPTGGHNIPVYPFFYRFVLDGVYFHRNSNWMSMNPTSMANVYGIVGQRRDSVINIFLTHDMASTIGDPVKIHGYVQRWDWSMRNNNSYKATFCHGAHYIYSSWRTGVNPAPWSYQYLTHFHIIQHEIGHLFGLDHTVLEPTGVPCGWLSPSGCGDACPDTQSAWEAFQDNQIRAGGAPPCDFQPSNPACSNNLMDYSGRQALSPCQLQIIKHYLDTGMSSFTACKGVNQDKTVCSMGYPVVAEFGRQVFIRPCSPATTLEVSGSAKLETYFSQSVDLGAGFSVGGGTEWSVIHYPACP